MIRVNDLITDIRNMISEPNEDNTFFTNDSLLSSINSVANILGRDIRLPQAILVTTLQKDTAEFALDERVQNVLSVKLDDSLLEYYEYSDYLKEASDNAGKPTRYYLREHYDDNIKNSVIALGFDSKLDKQYTIEIQAVIYPPRVSSVEDTLPFGEDCFLALKYGVLAEIYEKDIKMDKATFYISKYNSEIEKIKGKFFNRITEYVR